MQAVKNTIAENLGGFSHSLAKPEYQFDLEKDVPDQTGKVAVITGGSEGVGYGCTHTLLAHGAAKVFIISLKKEVFEKAKSDVSSTISPEAAGKMTWFQCDMGDWHKVAEVAGQIAEQTDRVDILINDAARGIMTYQLTEYGMDRHMAVNHMGHTILTSHLEPLMKSTAKNGHTVRIVNVGSNAHEFTPKDTKFASLDELNRDLGPNPQYGRAKLATMLHTKWLTKHLNSEYPNILANCVHPGVVESTMSTQDIYEPYPIAGAAMAIGLKPFKKDFWMGCVSSMYAATKTEKSGEYICPPAIPEPGSELFQDKDGSLAENLMRLTKEIVASKTKTESVDKGCPMKMA
ncbi:NAD(P)-binding Rossmann-fold containing protein [Glarea lozoyensis ATCC 20868]|uniref:NAD(P)-binding Rossmann-fold containing protein n=2 Tax=Glarea lozoyensis TaxID=101852 RepID=S3DPX2_GLAL2|nr:NAD(P)-binding Rossmann-fold containing protein [Glarea lozoyensis ATCC 20868]EHK98441.1 putative oxidoreductase bli-4, mitochondrial [Glarea lozoyensis 74030]EPE28528.1 NAD(P)-binding Rossmann-fold containing protein [Glarea lozoyensis ATCC 20868]